MSYRHTAALIALGAILAFGNRARADAPPATPLTATVAGEILFDGLLIADRAQTRSLHNFCDGRINCKRHELNPILGNDPSNSRIDRYFIGAALAHGVVTYALPAGTYRDAWQASTIALEAFVVIRNRRLDIRMKF